ncbi:MAG: flagellar basal body rod C-terminal domain-containing protein [Devosia sp.]|nr:flagellar basal body rod C-terminal domain-containing protein [Devosia sp.]
MSNSALPIALSGLQAATIRLDAAAFNIANVETSGGIPRTAAAVTAQIYQPVVVTLSEAAQSGGQPSGVVAQASGGGYSAALDPDAPFANPQGLVAVPDVDLATAMNDVANARLQFEMAARLVTAADEMGRSTIDMSA